MSKTDKNISVKLIKSPISHKRDQGATLKLLGLRKIGQTKNLPKTKSVLGMINKIRHLVVIGEDNA